MIRQPSGFSRFWESLPLTSKSFMIMGLVWSLTAHLISATPLAGSGLARPWVILTCVGILISGLLLCLITSTHWLVYGWLSLHRPHPFFMLTAGLLMLAGDVYVRTHTTFVTTSATDPIAVIFIPLGIGGSILPITYLADWIVVKR